MLNCLSLDVVRMIFEDWVPNKLTDLSSLDIAFTNRQARAVLLKELLPFVTPVRYSGGSEANDLLMRALGEYKTFEPTVKLLVWLSKRKVPVTSLFVDLSKYAYCKDTTPFTLRSVRTLHLIAHFNSMSFHWPCLEAFLPSFPNLTELDASKWGEMEIESVQQLTSLGGTLPLKVLNLKNQVDIDRFSCIADCVHAFPLIDELLCPVDNDTLISLLDVTNQFRVLCFTMVYVDLPEDAVLYQLVGNHAATLERLTLQAFGRFDIHDQLILKLVAACPNVIHLVLINDTEVVISPALLSAIAERKGRLQMLSVNFVQHLFE